MKHYKFGYARVSTEQQNLARQLDMLSQYGVDYIFNEKMTGTKRDRPELNKLLVQNGVAVSALYVTTDGLEKYFIERVGG